MEVVVIVVVIVVVRMVQIQTTRIIQYISVRNATSPMTSKKYTMGAYFFKSPSDSGIWLIPEESVKSS